MLGFKGLAAPFTFTHRLFCGTQRVPAAPQAFRGRVIQDLWAYVKRGWGLAPMKRLLFSHGFFSSAATFFFSSKRR